MPIDVGELLDRGPWPPLSKLVTVLAALTIIFDGFDISIAGYAVPSIVRAWHLSRASLSPLLVIGLVGMTVGSSLAGVLGDRLGRRLALLTSVFVFGSITAISSFAPNLLTIEILRFLAATGIGGAIPNATTLSAEFTPYRHRAKAVMLTIVCVPLGGALAGQVAQRVLPTAGWRGLFLVGGLAPLVLAILLFLLLPESPRFLARHVATRGADLRKLLARLGHAVQPNDVLTEGPPQPPGQGHCSGRLFRRRPTPQHLGFVAGLLRQRRQRLYVL